MRPKRNQKLNYSTAGGDTYSVRVETIHRDNTLSARVLYILNDRGDEILSSFQGYVIRRCVSDFSPRTGL